MRCDANISIRPVGESKLGTKVELKNLNSISFVRDGIAHEVLEGAKGARREVVLLNAAAALRAAGLARDWKEGLGLAAEAIDSGRAAGVLERWARISQA